VALGPEFFARDVVAVARDLIGCTLTLDGVGGRLVEVEAYRPDDPASHAFRGPTRRNAAMFGPPGRSYVYRSYGVHWLLNLVCDEPAVGAAVLVRALVPERGRAAIAGRRRGVPERGWCRGPGCLSRALAIGPHHDGLPLDAPPFAIEPRTTAVEVVATPRIGITKAVERPWRFVAAGSPYASGRIVTASAPGPPSRPLAPTGPGSRR
jgi:DNA-3-methyladenine glycosylase